MAFRTKLDFSSNRQVKQHEKTITALSGGTSFGLTYSAMTYGPDLTTSGISETYTSIASTFSGNATTTNYTWYDSRMYLGESELSAITPSNSASTQDIGIIFVANDSIIVDNNFVALSYSGVSYDLSVIAMYDLGGGAYSGTVLTNTLDILSASSLDYSGRTIWADVSGITRTERLIITDNPMSGYVWTCIDSEGMGEWQYNGSSSGSTIWTAGTGTSSAVLGGSDGYASGNYSVVEGNLNTASGDGSHAEGVQTSATGWTAHAEGQTTKAYGDWSHAEGNGSIASGNASHAQGWMTVASGRAAHAEGGVYFDGVITWLGNIASGQSAHVEGARTIAGGDVSHAGGYNSSVYSNFGFIHSNSSIITTGSNSSAILGGTGNTISGHTSSFIGGGENNLIDAAYYDLFNRTESIIGGEYNTIRSSQTSGIYAGSGNTIAYAPHSIIAGGYGNRIGFSGITTDPYAYALTSGIFAGHNNKIINNNIYLSSTFFQSNVILGGTDNIIDVSNTSVRYNAIIGGSDGNIGSSVMYSTLLGGSANSIDSGVNYSSIVAGTDSIITSADKALIGGGSANQIVGSSNDSAIIGGMNNIISNRPRSVILGGLSLTADSSDTTYTPNLSISYQDGSFDSKLAINTTTPEYVIDAYGNNARLYLADNFVGADALAKELVFSATSDSISEVVGLVNGKSISMGVIGDAITPTVNSVLLGNAKDTFITSSQNTNNLNIINIPNGGQSNNIRMYAGISVDTSVVADIHIQGTGSTRGYVGINNNTPTQQLDVCGTTQTRGMIIKSVGSGTKVTNLAVDSVGNVISGTTGDVFFVNKSPEAINFVAASPSSKGIPAGQTITGFTTTTFNGVTTTTTPFGTFNNATGVFTVSTTCTLMIQAWIHLKTDSSSTQYWSTTSTGQVGMGITVDNLTDFYCGDYQVALQNITNHIDISTSTIVYASAGNTFKLKVLNQTDRNYAGSGSISGDQARMSFTRLD